jgi:hypothetical protein
MGSYLMVVFQISQSNPKHAPSRGHAIFTTLAADHVQVQITEAGNG